MKVIENPILRGFNPDACVCQVGEDYYIATSTFEWWPGVEIYHSRNLVNWDLVSNPLTRLKQMDLRGNYDSGSIWAPNLTYCDGRFWLLFTDVKTGGTFKDTLNYLVSAPDIKGPWSDATFVSASGFDPSLFHDDDGKHYLLSMLFDHRLDQESFAGLVIQQFDLNQMRLIGEQTQFFKGTNLGVCEGPHLLKKDGYYYLLAAAGGTGYKHAATVCRSKNLMGPYSVSPYHPLLTSWPYPKLTLQKSGHASFVKVSDKEWYVTHICSRPLSERGNCMLGRETAIQPIEWINGWPRLKNGTDMPDLKVAAPSIGTNFVQQTNHSKHYDFSDWPISPDFKSLRAELGRRLSRSTDGQWLQLAGSQSLNSTHEQSLLARRLQSVHVRVETLMKFTPKSFQQLAGLVLYYDTMNWAYLYSSKSPETGSPYLQVQISTHGKSCYLSLPVEVKPNIPLGLALDVSGAKGQFNYSTTKGNWHTIGSIFAADKLSDDYVERDGHLAFTGSMVGICCQDMFDHRGVAQFRYFDYCEL